MGKRRLPRPAARRAKAIWDPVDDWALLGLLDFCIKYPHVLPFNEENVVGRLPSAGSLHDGYTWGQINHKLYRLWRGYASEDSKMKADIYVEGSACLAGLPEVEKCAVKSNVERLEKLLKPVCLEPFTELHQAGLMLSLHQTSLGKRVLKVPASRKTPSASPFAIHEGQSHTPECDASGRERLTPRAQRHQTRELVKQSKWKREPSEGDLCEDETPRKRTRWIKKGVSAGRQRCYLKKIADC
jgi:hypothetical protein